MHDHKANPAIPYVKIYFLSIIVLGFLFYGYKMASALEISTSGQKVQTAQRADDLTGATLQSPVSTMNSENTFNLTFGGSLQVDYHYYNESCRADNRFDIRRARVFFNGYFHQSIHYRLEYELQGNDAKRLLDAYGEITTHGWPSLRIGQCKESFSLEEQTKDSAFFFAERSMGNHFAPGYDQGLMIYVSFFLNSLHYAAGLFNGDGPDGSSRGSQNDGPELAARLLFTPFAGSSWPLVQSFQFGGSLTRAKIDLANVNLEVKSSGMIGTTRTLYVLHHNTKFGMLQNVGQRYRRSLEAAWTWGPLALQGEYLCLTFKDLEPSGGSIEDADFSSWYASALLFITGESPVFKEGTPQQVYPKKDFSIHAKTWGGFALALRKDYFSGDKKWINREAFVSVREANAFSIALNWLMNPYIRLLLDYTVTDFSEPIHGGENLDKTIEYIQDEHTITMRFSLTF